MNVLSLFDGISCGQLALKRAGIEYKNYFSSEIEKSSISITQHNFPNTIQLGDITKINEFCLKQLPKIDLIIAGSPCQGLSFSNTTQEMGFNNKSILYWEFSRILKWIQKNNNENVLFLLENVKMRRKSWEEIINQDLNIKPMIIDSSLLSSQKRIRLYWTNIKNVTIPADKNIFIDHSILENDAINLVEYSRKTGITKMNKNKGMPLQASQWRGINRNQKQNAIISTGNTNLKLYEVYKNGVKYLLRNLSPLECERLQTIPDNYTLTGINSKIISNSNRYRSIGNAWTIDVIAHILSFLKLAIDKS